MRIRSLKKLPERAQKMWESVFKEASSSYSISRATKIAWNIVQQNYKPERVGKKSLTITQSHDVVAGSTVPSIDVLLGYPGIDEQVLSGGLKLADAGWHNKPLGVLKGDMEHYYADKAEGLYIDINEQWEGWVPVAQSFWVNDEGGLHAKVELPDNHPATPNFIKEWSSGKYGLSIDYAYPEEAVEYVWYNDQLIPEVQEWHITGFTFTENPAFTKTKNGK